MARSSGKCRYSVCRCTPARSAIALKLVLSGADRPVQVDRRLDDPPAGLLLALGALLQLVLPCHAVNHCTHLCCET